MEELDGGGVLVGHWFCLVKTFGYVLVEVRITMGIRLSDVGLVLEGWFWVGLQHFDGEPINRGDG